MVYSWTIHGYEFQESNILDHELLMNSSWIVHGSANRFYTMNSSWFTHEQFMVMNFRKAGNIIIILADSSIILLNLCVLIILGGSFLYTHVMRNISGHLWRNTCPANIWIDGNC